MTPIEQKHNPENDCPMNCPFVDREHCQHSHDCVCPQPTVVEGKKLNEDYLRGYQQGKFDAEMDRLNTKETPTPDVGEEKHRDPILMDDGVYCSEHKQMCVTASTSDVEERVKEFVSKFSANAEEWTHDGNKSYLVGMSPSACDWLRQALLTTREETIAECVGKVKAMKIEKCKADNYGYGHSHSPFECQGYDNPCLYCKHVDEGKCTMKIPLSNNDILQKNEVIDELLQALQSLSPNQK